ncbi:MAG TPA: hypothetical protein VFI87_00750 [Hyphomicrobiaceae bacterium]|nr:hypothetical protein [Hyphomicrobiaceae bacterium]
MILEIACAVHPRHNGQVRLLGRSVLAWRHWHARVFRPRKRAPLSAAQEEDRSDIEDADHHGARGYHKYARTINASLTTPAEADRPHPS